MAYLILPRVVLFLFWACNSFISAEGTISEAEPCKLYAIDDDVWASSPAVVSFSIPDVSRWNVDLHDVSQWNVDLQFSSEYHHVLGCIRLQHQDKNIIITKGEEECPDTNITETTWSVESSESLSSLDLFISSSGNQVQLQLLNDNPSEVTINWNHTKAQIRHVKAGNQTTVSSVMYNCYGSCPLHVQNSMESLQDLLKINQSTSILLHPLRESVNLIFEINVVNNNNSHVNTSGNQNEDMESEITSVELTELKNWTEIRLQFSQENVRLFVDQETMWNFTNPFLSQKIETVDLVINGSFIFAYDCQNALWQQKAREPLTVQLERLPPYLKKRGGSSGSSKGKGYKGGIGGDFDGADIGLTIGVFIGAACAYVFWRWLRNKFSTR